ncbi:hypothetical protein RJT34_26923 [Clitoria ternatea]|uniref:Uncharacterized protein n=1 Tax=Clitoria ternatea TaxID=43366 RepID=A0AAN9FCD7_CLITE
MSLRISHLELSHPEYLTRNRVTRNASTRYQIAQKHLHLTYSYSVRPFTDSSTTSTLFRSLLSRFDSTAVEVLHSQQFIKLKLFKFSIHRDSLLDAD